ncbi:restriction endonuclease subunit S [Bradyrhizobium oligotrophicum]|uniref:restriction endonuclease subunit S n=1 Tax=Bradyrhizobium oligotrophicum TaxID=44255 RepID=UPI003EBA27A0
MAGEWITATLGDVLELKRGYDLPTTQRLAGSVPIISSSGVSGSHSIAMVQGPGVVTGRYGTIGQVFYVDRDFWPLNTTLYVRDFKGANPRFAAYFLMRLDFQAYTDKAAVPGINRNDLHLAEVRWPPREEQDRIANLLGALDDKIELNLRVAGTLEEMLRALFKSWFVDFDPVRAKAKGRSTGLSDAIAALFPSHLGDDGVPEGWHFQSMLDQANWVNGAAYKDMHFSSAPDALPVVKIAELKNGISEGTKWTNTDLGERYRIGEGELLFSWSGSPDTSIDTFVWVHGDAWLNQHVFAVRPNGQASEALLFSMLKFFKPTLIEIARDKQTTGLGHVTRQDMIRLKVCPGEPRVRAAFDQIAVPLFTRLKLVLKEIARLAAIRDTLLPKLISGELRIKDAENAVEAA